MPRRAASSRLIASVSCGPADCWSLVRSMICGTFASAFCTIGAHLFSSVEIDVGQRVLVLRRGQAAADVDVLHRLHEQPHADHAAHRLAKPGHDFGDRRTLGLGFSAMKVRPWFSVEVAPPAPI